ncbi:MAG: hypothetical protein A3B10_01275 [Candidatus Doudnabacteria bacterium RIFCSPLOWO2_01_FULL_44_21]|uniref:Uncharacterized protein n=1 Tax=Candidatus Doudnabacteria bacterium RIFCSPLOWO2_01_FULL_44_21 TaxID=1817841 RepID=A0A1F5PX29_9BACT|nr:MAG: hypothetical protein A3B95_04185 [Candidatus Doudnabacteria bacterium RIFCSPHIGHO2_02_FULL_43_13b]OGE94414.1 MAG: hypothetical protein A3B10_01275 [Candidatus Doudnabacteria bacterium RIFCSPLOWO2_01_FULL_44_21]
MPTNREIAKETQPIPSQEGEVRREPEDGTSHPTSFEPRYAKDRLVDQTREIIPLPAAATDLGQTEKGLKFSDETQRFIDRFAASKSGEESKAILDEVLSAASKGDIPPNEINEILSTVQDLDQAA